MRKRITSGEVKKKARQLGADLVGIAPVSRWEKAPIQHRSQGVFPEANSVIVCGIHFLDANTELAAEQDVRFPGSGWAEMNATAHLQALGFQLARHLQEKGCRAVPIIPTML